MAAIRLRPISDKTAKRPLSGPEVFLARRTLAFLAILSLSLLASSVAAGGGSKSKGCGGSEFSYAGLQSQNKAHGVSAKVVPLATPSVAAGHVGAWIGVGGVDAGPHGTAEWIQIGYSAFPSDQTSRIYYEVTVAGSAPKYVELTANVKPGEKHGFKVLEMATRSSWWRVWLDGKAVSPAIHLPGSHLAWYPQAMAESWNGNVGACNTFHYGFSKISLARSNGGVWQPLKRSISFHDAGYRFVQTSRTPRKFLAASLS
jgi:hypothetical protein